MNNETLNYEYLKNAKEIIRKISPPPYDKEIEQEIKKLESANKFLSEWWNRKKSINNYLFWSNIVNWENKE